MKKHCDLYYTTRHVETSNRNNSTPVKLYAWYIRNKERQVIQSSTDEGVDWGDKEGLYYDKEDAEYDAKEAIEEYYR